MLRGIRGIICLLITLLLIYGLSCETVTSIVSWHDSTLAINKFNKILIYFSTKDTIYKKAIESEIVNRVNVNGNKSISSFGIIKSKKKYTKKDFGNLLLDNNCDGILFVKFEGTKIEKITWTGKTYFTTSRKLARTFRKKGYDEIHRTVILDYRLFCGDSLKSVWHAKTYSTDPEDETDLAKSISENIIIDLFKKGFINYKKNITK